MHGGSELIAPVEMRFDKQRVKGTLNEIAGRARRQVGEWTGDTGTQAKGLAQERKGKAQQAWCTVKDALRLLRVEAAQEADKFPDTAPGLRLQAAFSRSPRKR